MISYVFAFRSQLLEIEIIDYRIETSKLMFKREELKSEIHNSLIIIKTICYKNDKHFEDKLIGNILEGETEIAFPIEEIEGGKFLLLPFPKNCPKLFCAFPMIGTSEFNFPVVLHSEKFVPNINRDGIELSKFDKENRERLLEAKKAFKILLEIVEKNQWKETYNICNITNPDIKEIETKEWFMKEVFNPIKEGIFNTNLIELEPSLNLNIHRKALSSIYIPYVERKIKEPQITIEIIYNLGFKLIPEQLPKKDHILNWYQIINFEIFNEIKLDIDKLCEIVANPEKISKLSIKYLYDLVTFIISKDRKDLLDKYGLLSNQKLQLKKIKLLKNDRTKHKSLKESDSEKLKDIYNSISGKDCRENLLHKEFETIENIIENDCKYDFEDLAKNTDEELRNYEGNFQDEGFLLILKDLFNWFTTCELSEDTLINLFPYFSQNKAQLYLNTKTSQELEYAFDIEISGKSEVLAKLAKSSLSISDLDIIAENSSSFLDFVKFLNSKQEDNPNEELGQIGEEFLHNHLIQVFGKDKVLWENTSEYDFRILENDLINTKYYIDAKTTGKGISNSDNVPFFMRIAQWTFLDKNEASDKYIIARIFKNENTIDVKYLKLDTKIL